MEVVRQAAGITHKTGYITQWKLSVCVENLFERIRRVRCSPSSSEKLQVKFSSVRMMLVSFAMVSGYMVQPLGSAPCHARAAGAARLPSPCLQADDGPLAGAQAAFSIYQKSQAQHREVEKHVWWMLWIKSRCFKLLCMVHALLIHYTGGGHGFQAVCRRRYRRRVRP